MSWAYDHENMVSRSSGAFPQIAGMQVACCVATVDDMRSGVVPVTGCDAALLDGGVVTSVQIGGNDIDLSANYRIAANNFIADGGDYYQVLRRACRRQDGYCVDTGILVLDVLLEDFAANEVVVRGVEGRISAQ